VNAADPSDADPDWTRLSGPGSPPVPPDVVVPHRVEDLVEARELNDLARRASASDPSFATPEGLAHHRSEEGSLGGSPSDLPVTVVEVPGPAGPLSARVLRRDGVTPRAVVLELHGGGWCTGSAAAGDGANAALAAGAEVVVVSLDYRLAPEHPFPAAIDDAAAAGRWLLDHAAERWGTDRLVLSGSSAGAHLAATTLLHLRDTGADLSRVLGANLLFGLYDLGMTPSQRAATDAPALSRTTIEILLDHATPGLDVEQRRRPAYSPLYADLSGLPPTLLSVGTLDPLLDDSLLLRERLRDAGNDTRLDVYPECAHAFTAFPSALGRRALARTHGWVADLVRAG